MSRLIKIVLALTLIIISVLTFVYPHWMVGPGKLIPGHQELNHDCFACHSAFIGVSAERCLVCHRPSEIGKLTSRGEKITNPLASIPFHQQLMSHDCIGCHSDHAGVTRYKQHGSFNHHLLKAYSQNQCRQCHKPPKDALHQKIAGECSQCHRQEKWLPATFEHQKYFVLDEEHRATCLTCHVGNDYQHYTCYGCHEHTPMNIRRKHMEEGVRDINHCAKCHRSADEEEAKGGEGND